METTCSEVGWGNRPCIIDATCENPDSFFCEGYISILSTKKLCNNSSYGNFTVLYISPVAYPDFFYWNQQFVKKKPPWFRLDFETFYIILHQFGFTKKKQTEQIVSLFIIPHLEITRTWWERRLLMVFDCFKTSKSKIFMLNILSPQWISHGRRGLSQEDVPEIVFLLMFRKGLCFDPKVTITRQLGSVFESMCFHGFWRIYDTVYVNKSGGI